MPKSERNVPPSFFYLIIIYALNEGTTMLSRFKAFNIQKQNHLVLTRDQSYL